jgi:N-acetylglucosaminyldiphosphoundecaprenol N-acetyl-beta-D-mannosaminyltransferase
VSTPETRPRYVHLGEIRFDALQADEVVERVRESAVLGRGGRIVTPNVDIVRQIRRDPDAHQHLRAADLVVADGAPLVWASRLSGDPLPERVAGSDLVWSLSRTAAEHGLRLFLLGGSPLAVENTASVAADRLREAYPTLTVAGTCCPPIGFDTNPDLLEELSSRLNACRPDIVFVGLGFPKQEQVISYLADRHPTAWYLGCGAGIDFVAGLRRRAPHWMRRTGLEWLHRLASEPRRLFVRYVVHDVPAACGLLWRSAARRWKRGL